MIRIALVGAGAFGEKHLVGLKNIPDAEVVTVVSASEEESRKLAEPHGISDVSDSYEATLRRDDIDAVILTTPTPMHARQAIQPWMPASMSKWKSPWRIAGPMRRR